MASPQVVKVLVADDESWIRGFYIRMLSAFGFEITEAEDGEAAVNYFLNGNEYDLILMDKKMPKMNGVVATRALRNMGCTSKIVAITADESSMMAFMDAGVDAFMTKPVGRLEIGDILRTFNLLN
ncbi:two-component response regulator ORR41-like [Carex rostrata]